MTHDKDTEWELIGGGPRRPALSVGSEGEPVDEWIAAYLEQHRLRMARGLQLLKELGADDNELLAMEWGDGRRTQKWIEAVEHANERRDFEQMLSLIRYGVPVPDAALPYVLPFFERVRRRITPLGRGKPGRNPLPLYKRVIEDERFAAEAEVRKRLSAGEPEETVYEDVAAKFGMSAETLRNIKEGRHGAHERAKRQRRSANEEAPAVRAGSEGQLVDKRIVPDDFVAAQDYPWDPEFLQWLEDNGLGFLTDDEEPIRAINWNEDLPQDYWSQEWISAIEDGQKRLDFRALLSMIINGVPVPVEAEDFVIQFFKTVKRKLNPKGQGKGGRDPIPLYDRVTESLWNEAETKVKKLIAEGLTKDRAIERVSAGSGMSESEKETLHRILAGKHGAHERAKRRRRADDAAGARNPRKRRGP